MPQKTPAKRTFTLLCVHLADLLLQLILHTVSIKASSTLIFSEQIIISVRGDFYLDGSYFTLNTLSYPVALSCTLIFMETEQRLPSAEKGAWLDCLSVLNEMCLQNKPMGASIPRTSPVHHKKKSGHITITCVLFLTVLQLDVRHQSLQRQPREPLGRLTENEMLLAAILHILCPFSNPMLDKEHYL